MKRKAVLICFEGIDGSGKTTQAQGLNQFLKKKGIRTVYIWNKFEPLFIWPIIKMGKKVFLARKDIRKDYAQFSSGVRKLFQNRLLSTIFRFCYISEYIIRGNIKIRLPLLRGHSVVCDRYLYDVAVTLALDHGYSGKRLKSEVQRLARFLPEPDMVFLLDVPEPLAFQRKQDTPNLDYLKDRRGLYLTIAQERGAIILSGSVGLDELAKGIQEQVISTLSDRLSAISTD